MIKSLRLKNFKTFEKLDLPDVSNITLIGGRNNVGKSSLLEGIFLFYDIGNPGMFFRNLTWRGIELSTFDANTALAPIFHGFNLDRPISIAVSDDIYHVELKVVFDPTGTQKSININLSEPGAAMQQVKTDFAPRISYALNISYRIEAGKELKTRLIINQSPINVNMQFEPNLTEGFPANMRKAAIYLGLRVFTDPGEDAVRFSKLDIEKSSDRIIDFVKILEPNLVGVSVVPGIQRSFLYADIGLDRKIPISLAGEGVGRLLSIILAIATAKDGIVLIDEIESGIHHSVMPKVWEGICFAAREFNCQIIATTHSYEAVQTAYDGVLKADLARGFSYIRLDQKENDIIAKTYSHKVLGAALANGWEVR